MRLPPVDVLLSWPNPNYTNPVTRGHALVVVNSIFITLTITTVALRLYTRLIIKRWFGVDDVFIVLALLFAVGLTAVVLLANQQYGWDRHVWDIPLNKFVPTSKIAMAAKIIFTAAATFTRLSLLCFYYRLVSDSGKKWFKWLVHANVLYSVGILFSFLFLAIFQCSPVHYYWMIGAPEGSCMDEGVVTLICGIINCIADFATTVTPMPLVFGLMMPRRQRFAVAFLFGLGIIVTIAGIVRTWYIYRSLIKSYDQTWYAYPLWIAAAVEIDLGVICASAPVLRPLLAKIPFSLSDTFSRGISLKRSTGYPSNATPSATAKPKDASAASSKRRSTAPRSVPELANDRGKSYELKQWDDVEQGVDLAAEQRGRGSQDAILEVGGQGKRGDGKGGGAGAGGLWKKITARSDASRPATKDDMTITRTSEVELQIEESVVAGSAAGHSRRVVVPDSGVLVRSTSTNNMGKMTRSRGMS